MSKESVTVGELIAMLTKLDPTLPVVIPLGYDGDYFDYNEEPTEREMDTGFGKGMRKVVAIF